jgi:hypothetical protein
MPEYAAGLLLLIMRKVLQIFDCLTVKHSNTLDTIAILKLLGDALYDCSEDQLNDLFA